MVCIQKETAGQILRTFEWYVFPKLGKYPAYQLMVRSWLTVLGRLAQGYSDITRRVWRVSLGQISMKIVKQAEFDFFKDLPRPSPVNSTINNMFLTAEGPVTQDVTISANLINCIESDYGAVISPTRCYATS